MASKPDLAVSLFHAGPLNANCAQSILTAFHGSQSPKFAEYQDLGGGRAIGGICGALQAAINEKPDLEKLFTEKFKNFAGGTTCQDIKGRRYGCEEYVRFTAKLVEDAKK